MDKEILEYIRRQIALAQAQLLTAQRHLDAVFEALHAAERGHLSIEGLREIVIQHLRALEPEGEEEDGNNQPL